MMVITPFRLSDVADLPPERLPAVARDYYSDAYVAELVKHGPGWCARIDGRLMLIAGVAYDIERVGWLWSFLAKDSGPHMLALTRVVQRTLATLPRPLRSTAEKTFQPSCRWLRILGFRRSTDPLWPPGPDFLFELT